MNGAMADPLVKIIIAPNKRSIKMIGKSQNFFRSRINPQRSRMKSITFSYLISKDVPSLVEDNDVPPF